MVDVLGDLIVPLSVGIPGCQPSLRAHFVPIPAISCDEGGEVAVFFSELEAVVSVPGIVCRLECVMGDLLCLFERWFCMVCLSLAGLTQMMEVHSLLGSPLCFLWRIILWHHIKGVFGSTFSRTPRCMSLLRSFFTCFSQWAGTEAGMWAV